MKNKIFRQRQRGFSLLEVLVAVLVLAIGLLGVAGLQAVSMRVNFNSEMRTQATFLAYDVLDRMRANRAAALAGDYSLVLQDQPLSCDREFVPDESASLSDRDLAEWANQVGCFLSSGKAAVGVTDGVATIQVEWFDTEADAQASITVGAEL
ncbi:type IV pilus modification protein PilV [Alkalilimnicola ehrlichii]|nr:type IV pilus modification protein PilV [Alkalilimnicola ehrlichii]